MTANKNERPKPKHPSHVANARALNERLRARHAQGQPWPGGRPMSHGLRALELLLRRGARPSGPVGNILIEVENRIASDLGGWDGLSDLEAALIRRLAGPWPSSAHWPVPTSRISRPGTELKAAATASWTD